MARITLEQFEKRMATLSRGQFLRELHGMAIDYAARAETRSKAHAGFNFKTRSGALKGSIRGRVRKKKNRIAVVLTAGGGPKEVKYARTHEQDGQKGSEKVIKGSPWLTIPVHKDLKTAGGDQKYPNARSVPNLTFYRKEGTSNLTLINWETKEVWYVLRRQVTIPARPFMRPAMDAIEGQWVPEIKALLRGIS